MSLNSNQIRWAVLGMVHERGHVTFAEIKRFVDTEDGNNALYYPDFENIVIWNSLTIEGATAVQRLINEKSVFIHPSTQFTHLIDGVLPNLPIAESLRQYKKPHWFPVSLHYEKYKE